MHILRYSMSPICTQRRSSGIFMPHGLQDTLMFLVITSFLMEVAWHRIYLILQAIAVLMGAFLQCMNIHSGIWASPLKKAGKMPLRQKWVSMPIVPFVQNGVAQ